MSNRHRNGCEVHQAGVAGTLRAVTGQDGYRLVYEVRDTELIVLVVAVGKRERNAVYRGTSVSLPEAQPDQCLKTTRFCIKGHEASRYLG